MNKNLKYILVLICLSYVFLMLGNGILSLTSPDEVFYSLTAKEMMEQKTWMTPYIFGAPQFEKPVFTYWLLRIGFEIFGIAPFVARLFPAVFASLGVIAVYLLGVLGFGNKKKAFISGLVLMSSALYMGLARTVFTDMIFSVLILFSLASFYWGYVKERYKGMGLMLFFAFSAFAVLTKGPLGLLIPLSVILAFLFVKKDLKFLSCGYSFWGILIFAAISVPWYALMIKKYGSAFTYEFFYNDHIRRILEAEHISNDTWYFYPVSVIVGTLPWSLYTVVALFYLFKNLRRNSGQIYIFLACWIGVNLLIFLPAHSKLSSYIFPLIPAVALVVGSFVCDAISPRKTSRLFIILSYLNIFIIALFPIALMVNTGLYVKYISSKAPVYVLSAALFLLALVCWRMLARRRLSGFIFVFSFLVLIILFGALSMHKDIESYVSSRLLCEYLLEKHDIGSTVLTSKPYARGVRYYTGKDIAVLAAGNNFFSPHPIPFLNTDELAVEFLKIHPVIYCVLKKNALEDVQRIAGKQFKATMLEKFGDVYVVKVEPKR